MREKRMSMVCEFITLAVRLKRTRTMRESFELVMRDKVTKKTRESFTLVREKYTNTVRESFKLVMSIYIARQKKKKKIPHSQNVLTAFEIEYKLQKQTSSILTEVKRKRKKNQNFCCEKKQKTNRAASCV